MEVLERSQADLGFIGMLSLRISGFLIARNGKRRLNCRIGYYDARIAILA